MHRGFFKIAANPRALPAFVERSFPLGCDPGERKGLYDDLFGIHGNKYGYTITHLASGKKCSEASNQAEAIRKCGLLRALPINWAIADPLRGMTEETREQVRVIHATSALDLAVGPARRTVRRFCMLIPLAINRAYALQAEWVGKCALDGRGFDLDAIHASMLAEIRANRANPARCTPACARETRGKLILLGKIRKILS